MKNSILRQRLLRELVERYTGLPDGYRQVVKAATGRQLRDALAAAREDFPGRQIMATLGWSEESP